ncbi:hypothetical protein [Nostoc sp. 106C]|uniref:hypothetical protein n=1 Tax=Nostoc sp. 106C TaxID=1932667 RepID=UPI000A38F06D|nr:hypothetical protein [Nostoc sp. 106C]OUL21007.1 hypothetical protein BV378_27480 [Nostoc sp. RF31YmG]OUL23561.1 hypothetical protein BV375_25825 [Nostoc sp. 106C]
MLFGSKDNSQPSTPSTGKQPTTPASSVTQFPTSQNRLQSFPFDVVTVDAKGKPANPSKGEAKYFVEDLGNGVTLDMVQILDLTSYPTGNKLQQNHIIERKCDRPTSKPP